MMSIYSFVWRRRRGILFINNKWRKKRHESLKELFYQINLLKSRISKQEERELTCFGIPHVLSFFHPSMLSSTEDAAVRKNSSGVSSRAFPFSLWVTWADEHLMNPSPHFSVKESSTAYLSHCQWYHTSSPTRHTGWVATPWTVANFSARGRIEKITCNLATPTSPRYKCAFHCCNVEQRIGDGERAPACTASLKPHLILALGIKSETNASMLATCEHHQGWSHTSGLKFGQSDRSIFPYLVRRGTESPCSVFGNTSYGRCARFGAREFSNVPERRRVGAFGLRRKRRKIT